MARATACSLLCCKDLDMRVGTVKQHGSTDRSLYNYTLTARTSISF